MFGLSWMLVKSLFLAIKYLIQELLVCILAMRMAFDKFQSFPGKMLKFIADGYSAYPLAKKQFELEENDL